MAQPAKPNILFVMADQLAARFLPFHGHRLVKTPALSRLALARDREVAALAITAAMVSVFLAASALLVNRRFGRRLSLLLDEIRMIGNDLGHRIAMDGDDELNVREVAAESDGVRAERAHSTKYDALHPILSFMLGWFPNPPAARQQKRTSASGMTPRIALVR